MRRGKLNFIIGFILVFTCLWALSALAATNWKDNNSTWSTPGNWDNGLPNSSTDAVINLNNSTVTLDITGNVLNLTIGSGNALTTNTGVALNVFGNIANAGQITFNGGGGSNTSLVLNNNLTLSGGGMLTLSIAGGGGGTFIQQAVGGLTLTNQSTIEGSGIIGNGGLTLSNSGTINANVSGQALNLNGSGGITNTSLLEASSGGFLQLSNTTVTNTGGNITANSGSNVQLLESTIQGGTLTNNGTFFGTPSGHSASLNGTTINGTYTSDLNSVTHLLGTITNNGNIQVNGGSGSNAILFIDNNVTLQGGGTVTLSTLGGGGNAFIEQTVGGLTLTNTNNTIQGAGIIGNGGLALSNSGTINANVSGQALNLNGSGGITNTGLLEASSGGFLQLSNTTVNNAGGQHHGQ